MNRCFCRRSILIEINYASSARFYLRQVKFSFFFSQLRTGPFFSSSSSYLPLVRVIYLLGTNKGLAFFLFLFLMNKLQVRKILHLVTQFLHSYAREKKQLSEFVDCRKIRRDGDVERKSIESLYQRMFVLT